MPSWDAESFREIPDISQPASTVLNVARGRLQVGPLLAEERVEAAHQEFSDRLCGHRRQGNGQVCRIGLGFKSDVKRFFMPFDAVPADFRGFGNRVDGSAVEFRG